MTIGKKIVAGFVAPLVMLAVAAALSYWSTAQVIANDELVAHTHEVLDNLDLLLSTLKDAETGQRGYLLTDEESYLDPYTTARDGWTDVFTNLKRQTIDNDRQQGRLDALKPQIEEKFRELKETIELRKAGKGEQGLEDALKVVRSGQGKKVMDLIRDGVGEMRDAERRLLGERAADSQRTVLLTRLGIGLGGLLACAIVFVVGWFVVRSVTRPVRSAIQLLTTSSNEILATATQQAAGAREQAAAVTETVATVDEVTQTAEQSTQRAKALADAVHRTQQIGQSGRKAAEDSIAALTKVQEQVEATAENILALAEQAQAIGEITAAVADVAEQTNLLALNAAIEASRAGEHGKGFAVVAGEVKALADQSKKATAQVRQILGEIQKGTNAAVLSTEEVTKGVASAGRVTDQAGQTIKALAETLAEAAQAAAQITASAGQQATGMAQIHQAMRNIDEAARQNLAALRQSEQAAQNLTALGGKFTQFIGK